MKYNYEFKKECVQKYREGEYPKTPKGINTQNFRSQIRQWVRLEDVHGPEILKHESNIKWTSEEKLEMISKIKTGKTINLVAIEYGINKGQLYNWLRNYRIYGYNGLINRKKGRKQKNKTMTKKTINPKPLTESEREELIRLRVENEYIKAENEIIKKELKLQSEVGHFLNS